jgi:hypothetical protein
LIKDAQNPTWLRRGEAEGPALLVVVVDERPFQAWFFAARTGIAGGLKNREISGGIEP